MSESDILEWRSGVLPGLNESALLNVNKTCGKEVKWLVGFA